MDRLLHRAAHISLLVADDLRTGSGLMAEFAARLSVDSWPATGAIRWRDSMAGRCWLIGDFIAI